MAEVQPDDVISLAQTLELVLKNLTTLQKDHGDLAAAVDAISGKVNVLASVKQVQNGAKSQTNGSASRPNNSQRIGSPLLVSPTIGAMDDQTLPASIT